MELKRWKASIVIHILGIFFGVFFLITGIKKFQGWDWALQSYSEMHHPLWKYYLSATVEVIGGLGMLIPRVRFYSIILLLALIGFISIHPWGDVDVASQVPGYIVALVLIALAVWIRRRTKGE